MPLIKSAMTQYDDCGNVYQVLIFTNENAKIYFEHKYADLLTVEGISYTSPKGLGAAYMCRAIRHYGIGNGCYAIIRCGVTGTIIYDNYSLFPTPEDAFENCFQEIENNLAKF